MSSYGAVLPWIEAIVRDPSTPLEPADFTVVADVDGEVVGYAAVSGRHIENLYILPSAQGHGVGARLVAEVGKRTSGPMTLRCLLANPNARRFYERHGFEVIRVERIVYHQHELEAWFMEKRA